MPSRFMPLPVFNLEGAAAPAPSPVPTPPASPPPVATPQPQPQPTPAPSASYVPEGLPEGMRGGTERETIDKLWGAMQHRQPPAAADAYVLNLPPDLAAYIDPKNDSVLPVFQQIAHKHGLSQQQYEGVIVEMHQAMAKQGLIEPMVDVAAELRAMGNGMGDPAAQLADGKRSLAALEADIQGLVNRQLLDKASADALIQANLGRAHTVKALRALLSRLPGERGLDAGGSSSGVNPASDDQARYDKFYPSMTRSG